MVSSLDGFIARRDGRVDWLETPDVFEGGTTLDAGAIAEFLASIDCYVMGSQTYETALRFEQQGHGWAYGDTPVFVLTSRTLPRTRESVTFHAGDLTAFVRERLRPAYGSIWVGGGGAVASAFLRLGLADELRHSIVPVLIGDGIPFYTMIDRDVSLHLLETTAYTNGMVELRYAVR